MSLIGIAPLWGWLGLGLTLIAIEAMVAPGTYLLWIGLAAIVMAGLSLAIAPGPGGEIAIFAVLALAFGGLGWRVYGSRSRESATELDDPALRLVGREFALHEAIAGGIGQLKVDDSVWRASGPDLPAGARVRVKAVDGSTLVVEPA